MPDTIIKSIFQGRIAATLVGLGATYLADKYGYNISLNGQELATETLNQILGPLTTWITSGLSLFLAIRSKHKEIKK